MIRIRWAISHCFIVLTFLLMLAGTGQAQLFLVGERYPTSTRPEAIVAADFDGDGDIDLAVGHRKDSSLIIYTNDGTGAFAITQDFSAFYMRELHTADLNGDGMNDLLACAEFGSATFWYSNGDGTFDVGLSQDFGVWPEALCAADFDGDGIVDVAYNNIFAGTGISIKFGLGNGAFEASTVVVPSIHGYWIGAGDWDNDGDIDIVFDSVGIDYTILNHGDGTFADRQPANGVNDYVVTNLNGDEYPDLLGLGTFGCNGTPFYVLGTPEGTFSSRVLIWRTLTAWDRTQKPVAADFNGDGHVDFAICAPDTFKVLIGLNDGLTGFDTRDSVNSPDTGAYALATGDFDGDGDPDLAVTCTDDSLSIFLSQGAQHTRRILVPDDIPTIQGAIESAWNLDTIVVQPGTYVENIDFGGKNLVLMSQSYAAEKAGTYSWRSVDSTTETILDGGGTGRVLTFDDFEDDRSVVAGFTIQNGGGEGLGGAVYCYDTACPTIIHNVIRNNHAASGGGGLFLHQGPTTVKYNLIVNNSSGNWGGGIYVASYSATIMNNTVCGNTAVQGGGGLYFNYGDPTVCNNIFWGNVSDTGGNQFNNNAVGSFVVTYSLVEDGWPGFGNFDADPMFVDPVNGDYRLLAGSPCIDAGDPAGPIDPDGSPADLGAICYLNPTVIGDGDNQTGLPTAYGLAQNYPNPFNPETSIEYSLASGGTVRLEVFNVLGQRVRTLVDRQLPAGTYTTTWNGRNDRRQSVGTGIYFYRLETDDYTASKKMLLVK